MAADELNCSDGAKMLIERMQSNPEEFGHNGRWSNIINQMLEVRKGTIGMNRVSRRDMNALFDAYETYIMEPKLAESIINELMEPKAEKKKPNKLLTPGNMSHEMLKLLEQQYSQAYCEYEADRAPKSTPWEKYL